MTTDETHSEDVCTCGDVWDEHGHDETHPGSTACAIKGCGCIAFEAGGVPRDTPANPVMSKSVQRRLAHQRNRGRR